MLPLEICFQRSQERLEGRRSTPRGFLCPKELEERASSITWRFVPVLLLPLFQVTHRGV